MANINSPLKIDNYATFIYLWFENA